MLVILNSLRRVKVTKHLIKGLIVLSMPRLIDSFSTVLFSFVTYFTSASCSLDSDLKYD